jgi:DNA-binding NarL/FixJ family response regulator
MSLLSAPVIDRPARCDRLPALEKHAACVSVLIATPDEVQQDGLRSTFRDAPEMDVVGTASTGLAAIAQARRRRPDVALVDLRLGAPSGIESAAMISRTAPHCRVILCLDRHDPRVLSRAWEAGIRSYVLSGACKEAIRAAVRCVADGRDYIDPQLTASIAELADNPLTAREMSILALMSHGLTNNAVAARLDITDETVKTHVKNILGKLQADGRTHAVAMGLRSGLIA